MNQVEILNELAKRRGFFFPANNSYGGIAGFYVYGPVGSALKNNLESSWRKKFVIGEGNFEISTPTIAPSAVFQASGHIDGFSDLLIECTNCDISYRADHLLEDQHESINISDFSQNTANKIISENPLICPACNEQLDSKTLKEFNLMFSTQIGPGSRTRGYLRPETAQGIFTEFPRLSSYSREKLPFGVAQIGTSYRNEISPRKGLTRLREFTQAELELFIHPDQLAPSNNISNSLKLPLLSYENQQKNINSVNLLTAKEALESNIISNNWIAHYLELALEWYISIGIDISRFRYRQHTKTELAHYASDCWDAETEINGEWIEIAGFAHRGNYDLVKHGQHSNDDFTLFHPYDEPQKKTIIDLNPNMGYFGPTFGESLPNILSKLNELALDHPESFDHDEIQLKIDGTVYKIPSKHVQLSTKESIVSGERIIPHVIEPSFGIDRTIYSILIHTYHEDIVNEESRKRLSLPPSISPIFVGVFPLFNKDGMDTIAYTTVSTLRQLGFSVSHDDSGSIGKRYRRQDEVGTPFCVTIDHQTTLDNTATLRDRDSAQQKRIDLNSIPQLLTGLKKGTLYFEDIDSSIIVT